LHVKKQWPYINDVTFFHSLAAENVWVEVTSMNDSRFGCAVVAHQGKIYVSGGFGSDKNILSSSEVYDPGKDSTLCIRVSESSKNDDYF
jgi:hypothetical protein